MGDKLRASSREQMSRGGRNNTRNARSLPLRARVLACIEEHGPSFRGRIARRLNADIYQVGNALSSLNFEGRIVPIGTAWDAGIVDRNSKPSAKMWAVAGTPPLARRPLNDEVELAPQPTTKNPERMAGWRTVGRGLAGWGGWGNWR